MAQFVRRWYLDLFEEFGDHADEARAPRARERALRAEKHPPPRVVVAAKPHAHPSAAVLQPAPRRADARALSPAPPPRPQFRRYFSAFAVAGPTLWLLGYALQVRQRVTPHTHAATETGAAALASFASAACETCGAAAADAPCTAVPPPRRRACGDARRCTRPAALRASDSFACVQSMPPLPSVAAAVCAQRDLIGNPPGKGALTYNAQARPRAPLSLSLALGPACIFACSAVFCPAVPPPPRSSHS
jgi:hypothetical protein